MTIAADLAERVLSVRYEQLPPEAVHWSKVAILDTVGVLLAGSVHEAAVLLRKVVLPSAGRGPCLVFGTGQRINALEAALANGIAGHVLDYDDSNSQLLGHPSVAILPALFAAAETTVVTGRDFIRAYVAGFEAQGRLGMSAGRYQYTHGWHPTTTVGIFGATAACSVLLGLTRPQTANALGIAAHMAAGIKSNFGTMTKSLGVGQSARNALLAVQLAREGFTSGPRAFEHHHGYFNVFNGEGNYDARRIFENWAQPLCILDQGVKQKRFPCCYACLPPIDAMQELVARHGLTPDNVARIECQVHPIRFPHINVPDPLSGLDAKFSVHYCLARALIDGKLAIAHFEDGAFLEAGVQALMKRVGFSAYEGDNLHGAVVRVTTTDGKVLEATVEKALGASYQRPLPADLVKQKFDDCAGHVLRRPDAEKLHVLLTSLERLRDMKELTAVVEAGGTISEKFPALA